MDLPIVAECRSSTEIATTAAVFIVCTVSSVAISSHQHGAWVVSWSVSTLAKLPSRLYAGGLRGADGRTAIIQPTVYNDQRSDDLSGSKRNQNNDQQIRRRQKQ